MFFLRIILAKNDSSQIKRKLCCWDATVDNGVVRKGSLVIVAVTFSKSHGLLYNFLLACPTLTYHAYSYWDSGKVCTIAILSNV